jgi:hypothetical protein
MSTTSRFARYDQLIADLERSMSEARQGTGFVEPTELLELMQETLEYLQARKRSLLDV